MEIKDVTPKQGNLDLTVDVIDVAPPREFEKFGKKGKVATAMVKDASGQAKMSLWNEQADQVKKGQKLHLINGYANEWQGEIQLTTGKMGKIEVIGEADTSTEAAPETKPKQPEEGSTDDTLSEETDEELDEDPIIDEEPIE